MPPAVIGAVAIGAATIGGAAISSHSTSKAANTAAQAQTQNTQASNALTMDIYNRNTANFTPTMQSGNRANALLDSFIYGPNSAPQSYAPQPGGYNGGAAPYGGPVGTGGGYPAAGRYAFDIPLGNGADGWSPDSAGYPGASSYAPAGPMPGAITTPAPGGNALSGYDAFVASPYYQNPLAEGYRALNHGLAATGRLESGDAVKRAIRYGQDYGAGRQDEYLNLVTGQANRGFGAASALAGVGQNMVNNITANNQTAADAIGNAALIKAQANNALVNGISSGLGTIYGGIKSSYKGF